MIFAPTCHSLQTACGGMALPFKAPLCPRLLASSSAEWPHIAFLVLKQFVNHVRGLSTLGRKRCLRRTFRCDAGSVSVIS